MIPSQYFINCALTYVAYIISIFNAAKFLLLTLLSKTVLIRFLTINPLFPFSHTLLDPKDKGN